jgi:aspartate-semialdehyde dehydrogenase
MKKYNVAVIGCTGMVGQRFLTLLENHPWFELTDIMASKNSAGKKYSEAVENRWKMTSSIPEKYKNMIVKDAADISSVRDKIDFVFCAVNMKKSEIVELEESYAKAEIPVISNNSANRWTPDVPMVIPELNPQHIEIIDSQRKRLGTKKGFIAVKPNCSIQSYVPIITPLLSFEPEMISVSTYQAISGSGKTFAEWPEMIDNVIPYIAGEEEKSEKEPLKIWGKAENGVIIPRDDIIISAQCIRVPVTDGHTATVSIKFKNKPSKNQIIEKWDDFNKSLSMNKLPSSPDKFITYFEEDSRPQCFTDRNLYNGMGISCGRLREDNIFDYKFVGLSHNTLRGAAGGAVLIAELLCSKGYI